MSEPLKHHYLPEFYLSRWRNAQAKVIEFRFRFGKLEARPTSTKGTGYRPRLYSKSEGPDPHKIEKGFMRKLDTKASKVLDLFEAGVTPEQLSAAQRSDWSRFIMSLWMRTPADIQTMKECYCAEFGTPTAREEAKYRERRQPGWPETFAEALSQRPATRVHDDALDVAIRMMDHEGLGGILNNMIWYIIDVSASGEQLLTSDRPVMFDLPLVQHDSYVFMPISPRKVFVAVHNVDTLQRCLRMSAASRVEANNRIVVRRAEEAVYASDATQSAFIAEHISKGKQPSVFELLSRLNRNRRAGGERPSELT